MTDIENNHDHVDNNQKQTVETGAYLKSVRLSKKLTEENIYAELKIKARIIVAIENHHYHQLPDTVTVAALVRQYAAFLGLDAVQTSTAYKREMIGTDHKIDVIFPDKLPSSFKPFKQSIFFTVFCVVIYSVWHILNDTDNFLPEITSVMSVDTDKTLQKKDISVHTDAKSKPKPYKTLSQEIIPTIHFKIIKNPDIFIKATHDDSWLEITDIHTNRIIYSAILKNGQSYKIPVNIAGLRLKAGNTSPLSIVVNDQILPILPKNNRVLKNFDIGYSRLLKIYQETHQVKNVLKNPQ